MTEIGFESISIKIAHSISTICLFSKIARQMKKIDVFFPQRTLVTEKEGNEWVSNVKK